MRWHVHGTDSSGYDVVLIVEGDDASQAVQSAIDKRILVSHVTHDPRSGFRQLRFPITLAALLALLPITVAFYIQNISVRGQLSQAVVQQTKLAQTVAQAESLANEIRQAPTTPDEANIKIRQMAEQLTSFRGQLSDIQAQLLITREKNTRLQQDAAGLPALQSQLAAANNALTATQSAYAKLTQEMALQRRRLSDLENPAASPAVAAAPSPLPDLNLAKIRDLEAANKQLASDLDTLKTQLLLAAAHANASTAPEEIPPPAPAAHTRWALAAHYDDVTKLVTQYFEKDNILSTPNSDDSVVTSGTRPENAAAIHYIHDHAHERIYSGTLTLSLAPETPRDRLAENTAFLTQFVKAFAPSFDHPETPLANAVAALAGKDETNRIVLRGSDYQLTIWNNHLGLYTIQIQPPRADGDE